MKATSELGVGGILWFITTSILQTIYQVIVTNLLFFPLARNFYLSLLGAEIGKDTIIMNVKFFNWHRTGLKGLSIASQCFIGDETLIDLYDQVIFEDHVTLAPRVNILTHLNVGYRDHPLQKYFPKTSKPVVFKRGCVVGAASTVLPGVTIGEEAFVAAGSVVTGDVPPKTLVAGVPAKIVRRLK